MSYLIELLIARLDGVLYQLPSIAAGADKNIAFGIDMSIENLRSQQYSYYIFGFLIVSLIIFSFILYLYRPKKGEKLKRGERIMFGAIIIGVFSAVFLGWLQLVEGYLL